MQAKIWRVPQIFSLLGYLLILISVSALLGFGGSASWIGKIVFNDLDCDGIQDAGEPGIEGVLLKLYRGGGLIETTTTDANGEYKFWTWGHAWTYTIDVDESTLPDGFVLTTGNEPLTFTMERDKNFEDANFGYGQCGGGECGECKGGVTQLTLKYNGSTSAHVEVVQKNGDVVFADTVDPGEEFTFSGTEKDDKLGKEISIFVDGDLNTKIHTSCSKSIGPGLISGDFEVIAGLSKDGGPLCPVDEPPDDDDCDDCDDDDDDDDDCDDCDDDDDDDGGVELALRCSSANAAVGDTISLQLVLTSSEAVDGVSAYLSYDPAVLGVVDANEEPGIQPFTKGNFIDGLPLENSAADGVLRYSEVNVHGSAIDAGVVASISFVVNDVPEGGATTISFLFDNASSLVTGVSSGGTILQPTVTEFTLNVGSPLVPLPGDVNGDGSVNLVDFSLLAVVFGTANSSADFNGDGFVTLADFSILSENFGETADDADEAPSALLADAGRLSLKRSAALHRGDVMEVAVMAEGVSLKAYSFKVGYDARMLRLLKGGITEGDFLKDTLFVVQDGRVFSASRSGARTGTGVLAKLRFSVIADGVSANAISLRDVQIVDGAGRFSRLPELHAALHTVPHKTRLLANYPNPFNPETWIPFELAEDANVKVKIYDVSGRLVRTLDLGDCSAARYVERSAAAYWDGRNFCGERVASGVYLYRLTAGNFSAVRRMVVLK